jgi:hypothetical protein
MASKSPVWYVGTNQSTVGPKDPLPYDVKVEAMKTIWPEVESHIVAETSWLTLASEVYKDYPDATLLCLTDEDWVTKTIQQYNGKEGAHGFYNFKNITQRPTPRLSSATALRDAVAKGDRDAFTQAAGVSADTEVAGKPFFDLVAEYLLPYQNAPKKVAKKKVVAPVEGLRGTGNPGMPTPYDQGRNDAKKGRAYENPYDQPGEEQEHSQYKKGYEQGKKQGVAEAGNSRPGTTPGFQDTLTADEKRRAQRAAERQAQDKSTKSGIDKNRAKADAYRKSGVAEGSEQVYNILALDKGNALKKPTKLKWKASSLEDIFDALAAQDWYPLEINGIEVIAGKRLKPGVKEFAQDNDNGGDEDTLLKFARMWYNGNNDIQQKVEKVLDRLGWEIGELESEEGGAFVVRSGDENGDSYIGFAPEDLTEGIKQTLRKVVPGHAKREIDKKMDAGKFGKTDADKDANFHRYKKIQDKLK